MANRGGKVEVQTDFLFLALKSLDGDCSREIRRRLLLGRKAVTNLDSVLKSRDSTLLTKVHIVKAMIFSTVTYGCESWNIKEAECWRIDAFTLWCWIRLLKVRGQQGNQTSSSYRKSVLNIHWRDWCWSWNSSILVNGCEGLTHWKSSCCWERLRAEREEDVGGWDGWMSSPMQRSWTSASFRRWWGTERPGMLQSMRSQSWTRLGDWTTTYSFSYPFPFLFVTGYWI